MIFLKIWVDILIVIYLVAMTTLVIITVGKPGRARDNTQKKTPTGRIDSNHNNRSDKAMCNEIRIQEQEWQNDEQAMRNQQYMQQIMQQHQRVAEQAMRDHQQIVEQTMREQHQQFSDQILQDAQQSLSDNLFSCNDAITGFDNLGSGFDDFGGGFSGFGMF